MKNTSVRCTFVLLLGLTGLATTDLSDAATSTGSFHVSATVASSCSVNALPLNFGAFDPSLGTALAGSSVLNVSCTRTTPFTVALNTGSNAGSYTSGRIMISAGGALLTYNLYTSAPMTTVWGDGTANSATMPGTGAGSATAVPFTVYGRIPVQPLAVPAASYSDTITVTVTY